MVTTEYGWCDQCDERVELVPQQADPYLAYCCWKCDAVIKAKPLPERRERFA